MSIEASGVKERRLDSIADQLGVVRNTLIDLNTKLKTTVDYLNGPTPEKVHTSEEVPDPSLPIDRILSIRVELGRQVQIAADLANAISDAL